MTSESTSVAMPEPQDAEMEPSPAEQMAERLVMAALGMTDLLSVYIGDRLGLYRALHDGGAATPGELATRAGVHPRYAREWLEHQATTGIIEVAEPAEDGERRRYRLPDAYVGVFIDPDDLAHVSALARAMMGITRPLDQLLEAFRTGGGVPYEAYGSDLVHGQAGMNRPLFTNLLGSEWLPSIVDVHARLLADPPARVADVASGAGWSSIALARAYPRVTVDGYDIDPASIELARRNIAETGLTGRVTATVADAAKVTVDRPYDVITVFEAIHDLPRPVEVLANIRRMLADGGAVIVMDESVGDRFETPPSHPFEAFFYGAGMCLCLPASMADGHSVATGAVMRPVTLEGYAREVGFSRVEVLPIEFPFFRFYRLHT